MRRGFEGWLEAHSVLLRKSYLNRLASNFRRQQLLALCFPRWERFPDVQLAKFAMKREVQRWRDTRFALRVLHALRGACDEVGSKAQLQSLGPLSLYPPRLFHIPTLS